MSSCAPLAGAAIKNKITIIGCGTSWHASLLAEYLIEHIARIPVECQYASEFRHRQPLFHKGDTLIIVSNSGSTEDSVEPLLETMMSVSPLWKRGCLCLNSDAY